MIAGGFTVGPPAAHTTGILAHGFGIRYDLPVPLALYLGAAGAVVAFSFVLVAYFVRGGGEEITYLRLRLDNRPVIGPIVRGRLPRAIGGTIGVILLIATALTGFLGAPTATENPAEYLFWIYGWPLMLMVSSIVGNVYALVNPWRAIFDVLAGAFSGLARRRSGVLDRLGIWPATAAYLVFAFFELASGQSANPRSVAAALTIYTIYTLGMMVLLGREWLEHGEAITVLYSFVGAFGPVEIEDDGGSRRVYLRPWAVGLAKMRAVGWDVIAFIVLMLSSLAFDGLEATRPWAVVYIAMQDALANVQAPLIKLFGLIGVTAIFAVLYLVFIRLVLYFGRAKVDFVTASSLFSLTLVPIALVYFAAHFYSYVVIQSQGIIPLLADPFHTGARLLPTSGFKPSFALADAGLVWYLQVVLIVVGHVIAVYLAHRRALATYPEHRDAQRSQYPMLLLMVLYTCMSLWILAQPNVEVG